MAFIRALLWLLSFGGMVASHQDYDDSRLTLTSMGAPDPYVTSFRGRYYLTFTMGDRIEIWSSDSLVDIEATAFRHRIWEPPPATRHSAEIWAPELHAVRGQCTTYLCCGRVEAYAQSLSDAMVRVFGLGMGSNAVPGGFNWFREVAAHAISPHIRTAGE
ncbi:hypothetical protein O1611_g3982 [Lasiodiplodia mahajangana]|uniref:Uncharacterized protein n=1 Tax=Lasiodiplodia mahajangana TaxID=1108764 RepID=A0ACC2JQ63_9PEZI|nr:hypothetical protein O1611_g3982 [Lasiodiplodia mahajangana]